MFKKMLATMGIGNAEVDLVILTEELVPGYPFNVEVNIRGGEVAQELNGLVLRLVTASEFEAEDYDGDEYEGVEHQILTQWEIPVNMVIGAGEEFSEAYELVLHPETPITAINDVPNYSRVWIETGLDIEDGLDASDRDYLNILPTPTQAAVLNAMIEAGYYLKKIDVESGEIHHPDIETDFGCYQEFEFGLNGGGFYGIQEAEVTFINNGEHTGVVLEIDRAFLGDTYRYITLENEISEEAEVLPALEHTLTGIY